MRKDMKRLSLFLVLLFVCICIYPFSSYAESQKNFLWRAQAKNSTIYLLGSIHLLKQDVYPLNRIIEDSYDKSDFLAVEADIGDIANIDMTQVLNNAIYQGDDSIEKHISRDALAVVQKEAGRLGSALRAYQNAETVAPGADHAVAGVDEGRLRPRVRY